MIFSAPYINYKVLTIKALEEVTIIVSIEKFN